MAADLHGCRNDDDDEEDGSIQAEDLGHGHFFVRKTFHKPTYCHHCTDMLWGLIGQGYICEICSFVVHDRCLKTVVSSCASLAALSIANPVAHCWSEPGHFKRKFCNVCRKRLEDSDAVRCEICECYVHVECQDYVVSDCKECATYVPGANKSQVVQYHQWHEGNLPGNSKCFLCRKTCWSSECLAGMRCEWCGVMAHAQCYKQLPQECSFGCLREIMLPPYCLTVPRMNVSTEVLYGIQRRQNQSFPASSISDEPSSSGEMSRQEEDDKRSPKDKEGKEKDSYRDEEVVRVYDGSGSAKRKSHCNVVIPKGSTAQVLLEASMRAFRISGDTRDYFMSEITEPVVYTGVDEEERELDRNVPVRAQLSPRDGKRLVAYLRYREEIGNRGYVRVYPGDLRHYGQLSNAPLRNIIVTKYMTSREVLVKAIKKFGVNVNPDNFLLVEVLLDRGVNERIMKPDEKPLMLLQQKRKESLRQSIATRFYVRQKDDPHGPNIAVYVGNLPTGLSQRQYEKILLDIVGPENRWRKCDAIYYEQGALVLLYNDAVTAVRALSVLGQSSFDEKQLLVLLLPNVQPHMIPDGVTPLLVLVNVKSGGQQGQDLIHSFRKLLNPHQVYDLMNGGPLPGLYVFRNIPYFKIIVCGGDGTVGWALSCLDNVGQDALCDSPPMAIVPLGTGNDLARVLRWGPGFTGAEEPLNILRDVIEAEAIRLDRWTVIFHPNEKELDETKVAIANDTNAANTNEDTSTIFVMNNYFGIGIDADISLAFHNAREENPDKFNSRMHNKGVYLKMGLKKMVKSGSCKDLHKLVKLEVDGKHIILPPCEGLIILNILSWAGGGNPWGLEREDPWTPPTHYDGMLEVVGVNGIVHLGQIQSGIRTGMRIAQGGHIRIQMLQDVPVQVDGEPWVQPAGTITVLRSALKATMLKKTKSKFKRRNTEPGIYFPNESAPQASLTVQSPSEESSEAL